MPWTTTTTCRRSPRTRTSTKRSSRRRCDVASTAALLTPGDSRAAAPSLEARARVIVLGIDPGTAITGYGIVAREGYQSLSLLECGVIRTSAGKPLPVRIREIFEGIGDVIARFRPDFVSVEEVFQGNNIQSALTLGHARGAILLAASLQDVAIAEYSPREIKKAVVGSGNASKDQVGFMVKERLRLKHAPTPHDAADGVAAALCHCIMGEFSPVRVVR